MLKYILSLVLILPLNGFAGDLLSSPNEIEPLIVQESEDQEIVLTKEINQFEQSAYRIKNYIGNGSIVMGSGGLIDAADDVGLVLSCAHLFSDKVGKVTVTTADGKLFEGIVVDYNRSLDLSLIAISVNKDMPMTPLAMQNPQKGDKIITSGYGGGDLRTMTATVTGYSKNGLRWDMEGDRPLRSGDSGSLVWNENKKVVGIGWGTGGGSMYVVSLTTIHDFLDHSQKIKEYCFLFKNRKQRPGGCGPFGCNPRDDSPNVTPPSPGGAIPPPNPNKPIPIEPPKVVPSPIKGDKGDKGDKGADGQVGPRGPKGDPGVDGKPGKDADNTELLKRFAELEDKFKTLPKANTDDLYNKISALDNKINNLQKNQDNYVKNQDLAAILAKFNSLETKISSIEKIVNEKPAVVIPPNELLPIQKESKISHFVLVASQTDAYWPRLNGLVSEARKVHPFIKIRDPSELDVVVHGPKLVTYNLEGKEIAADQGSVEVETALQAIARGQFKR